MMRGNIDSTVETTPMLLSNAGDYTHSWWTYGLRDPRLVWSVQSNRYGLQFDVPRLNLTHLVRITDAAVPDEPNASLACRIRVEGKTYRVIGGLGYVPVTFSGLKNYRNPVLEMMDGDRWVKIDQSVHGNDFWQTDYDALAKTWEVTYNIPVDSESDKKTTRDFRFRI